MSRVWPLAVLVLVCTLGLRAQEGADEAAWVSELPVETIREMLSALDAAPLSRDAPVLRQTLFVYVDRMEPNFEVCIDQFAPLIDADRKRLVETLWPLIPIGSGAYLLDHPEAIDDPVAYQLAGLERMLRAYEQVRIARPRWRLEFLEGLLEAQREGTLREHVLAHPCDG